MFEKLDACPSCGHLPFEKHLACTDHCVSGEPFVLVRCTKCKLIFTNPRPAANTLSAYYKSENYISHTNQANSPINWIYKMVRAITLRKKLRLINQKTRARTLLDFGCGTGHFINYCEQSGWAVTGLEPDEKANAIAKLGLKGTVHQELKEIKETFDIITAWHVIEHVLDLNTTLKQLSKRLKDKGFLIIAVPNCNSHDAKHYKENWAGYDVPRHLYHFTQESFQKVISKHKLKLVEIHPMKYDAYYISLLSEKYTTGKSGFLRAMRIGKKSNSLAKKTLEYSSLIYVLSK